MAGPVVIEIREDSEECNYFQLIFKGEFKLVL